MGKLKIIGSVPHVTDAKVVILNIGAFLCGMRKMKKMNVLKCLHQYETFARLSWKLCIIQTIFMCIFFLILMSFS